MCRKISDARTILVLLLAIALLPAIFRERWLKVLNNHVTLKLKCSGPTGRAVGHVEFQRQRADIADGQTLTTSQYYYTIITPQAALAETIHGVQC